MTACLTYLGRNTLIILPMHVLAARSLAQMPSVVNPLLAGATHKVLAGLILLASIELLRRCPLIVPRRPVPVVAVAAHAQQTPGLAADAPADAGDR
jgi:fucose 4-O-acetylase-like acetyltransferase